MRTARLFAIVVSLGCAALPALAQTASTPASAAREDPVKLDVFEVKTSGDIGYQSSNAAEATRMNTPIENIPMNVTIFNQQFIEDLLATNTAQLLEYDASSVKRTENDGFLTRGSSSVGSNFLNGFAQTAGFGSQPLVNIERVEVLRGPAAVLYGSGGYGGIYNRITKQPRPNASASFRTIFSEDNGYRMELDYNPGALPVFGNKLLARVNGVYADTTSWFGWAISEKGIAPSLTWNIAARTKVTVEYLYNEHKSQAGWETAAHAGDPHGFVFGDGTYHVLDRKTNWVAPEDYRLNQRSSTMFDFRHAFSDRLQFRSQFQYETRDQVIEETVANGGSLAILRDTVLTGRYWRYIPRITRNYRTRNELIWEFNTGPLHHRFLGGHAYNEQYDRVRQFESARNDVNGTFANITFAQVVANPAIIGYNATRLFPVNMFNRAAEPAVPPPAQRTPLNNLTASTRTYTGVQEYYANDMFSVANERVFIVGGLRYTDYERGTTNFRQSATVELSSAPTVRDGADALTTSYGVVVHLNDAKTFSLYANRNSSFAPEFRVNPDGSKLDPEEGNQKEIGLRFNLWKGRMQGLVNYFDLRQNNLTEADPTRPGFFIQRNGQHADGFELNLNTRVTDNWLMTAGASDIKSVDKAGAWIDLQPRYKFTTFNRYNFSKGTLKGLSLSAGAIYTGPRALTLPTGRGEPNWGPAPSWWRWDGIVGYRLKNQWFGRNTHVDLSLKVTNVFDNRDIYYVIAPHRYTISAGREWQSVIGFKF